MIRRYYLVLARDADQVEADQAKIVSITQVSTKGASGAVPARLFAALFAANDQNDRAYASEIRDEFGLSDHVFARVFLFGCEEAG